MKSECRYFFKNNNEPVARNDYVITANEKDS